MQALGRGIAALGDAAFSFQAQQDKEAEFDDKLRVATALNAADAELLQFKETYQGDGSDFEGRSQDIYRKHMDPVTGELRSQRMKQSYPLLYEQQRGSRYEAAIRHGSSLRTQTRVVATQNLLETQIGALDWSSAEAAETSMTTAVALGQRMIDEIPGLTPLQREAQYKAVRGMFDQSINNLMAKGKIPAGVVQPTLERIREKLDGMVQTEPDTTAVGADLGIRDFTSKPGRGFGRLEKPTHIVLHDVSGDDPARKRVPQGGSIPQYHITFDRNGINLEVPFDRQAPHALAFNKHSIGISHIGYEGDKLDAQAIRNGAKAVLMVQEKFGIPVENILTHPEGGERATKSGGKDPKEASWRKDVLDYISANKPQLLAELKSGGAPTPAASGTAQAISQSGVAFIKKEEGWKPDAYADGRQTSIGWGTRGRPGEKIDEAEGERRLQAELAEANGAIDKSIKVQLNQTQRDALVSYVFNAGPNGAARNVFAAINDGDMKKAADLMRADDKNGVVANRRQREVAMFLSNAQPAPTRDELKARSFIAGRVTANGTGTARDANAIPGAAQDTPEAGMPRDAATIPATAPVRVADAGGQTGTATDAAKPGPITLAPGQRLKNSLALEMLRHLDEKGQTWVDLDKKRVEGGIKNARDKVLDGYPLDDQTLSTLTGAVQGTRDPALALELNALTSMRDQVRAVQTGPMPQTQALIAQYDREFQRRTPTDVEKKAYETLKDLAIKKEAKLREDPLSWARATGVIPSGVDITTQLNNPGALDARLAEANRVAQQFQQPPQYFTETERKGIAKLIEQGADPLAVAAPIVERWGPMHATQAMKELSVNMPEAAVAGYLLPSNPQIAMDISTDLKNRKMEGYKPIDPDNVMIENAKTSLGDTFAQFPKAQQDMLIRAATAAYRTRAHKMGQATEATFKQALNEVLGERKDPNGNLYGGIAETGKKTDATLGSRAHTIILPPQWKKETFTDRWTPGDSGDWKSVLQKVTDDDLIASGHPLPVNSRGERIPLATLMKGTLSHARNGNANGRYEIAQGVLGSPKEDWVFAGNWVMDPSSPGKPTAAKVSKPNGLFVLDLNKLYPILSRRYPGSFFPEK